MAWTLPPSWEKAANCWFGGCCLNTYMKNLPDICRYITTRFWHGDAEKTKLLWCEVELQVTLPFAWSPSQIGPDLSAFWSAKHQNTGIVIHIYIWHWVCNCGTVALCMFFGSNSCTWLAEQLESRSHGVTWQELDWCNSGTYAINLARTVA